MGYSLSLTLEWRNSRHPYKEKEYMNYTGHLGNRMSHFVEKKLKKLVITDSTGGYCREYLTQATARLARDYKRGVQRYTNNGALRSAMNITFSISGSSSWSVSSARDKEEMCKRFERLHHVIHSKYRRIGTKDVKVSTFSSGYGNNFTVEFNYMPHPAYVSLFFYALRYCGDNVRRTSHLANDNIFMNLNPDMFEQTKKQEKEIREKRLETMYAIFGNRGIYGYLATFIGYDSLMGKIVPKQVEYDSIIKANGILNYLKHGINLNWISKNKMLLRIAESKVKGDRPAQFANINF